jgi:hypothetical protein
MAQRAGRVLSHPQGWRLTCFPPGFYISSALSSIPFECIDTYCTVNEGHILQGTGATHILTGIDFCYPSSSKISIPTIYEELSHPLG